MVFLVILYSSYSECGDLIKIRLVYYKGMRDNLLQSMVIIVDADNYS